MTNKKNKENKKMKALLIATILLITTLASASDHLIVRPLATNRDAFMTTSDAMFKSKRVEPHRLYEVGGLWTVAKHSHGSHEHVTPIYNKALKANNYHGLVLHKAHRLPAKSLIERAMESGIRSIWAVDWTAHTSARKIVDELSGMGLDIVTHKTQKLNTDSINLILHAEPYTSVYPAFLQYLDGLKE